MNSEVINPVLSIKQEICEIIDINATLCFRLIGTCRWFGIMEYLCI